MKTTPNESFFVETLPAFDGSFNKLIQRRCKELLQALPDETDQGRQLLRVIGERFPEETKEIYREFVVSDSTGRRETMCRTLWYGHPLAPEILSPFLNDKRHLPSFSIPVRVCDRAARAISNYEKSCTFDDDASCSKRDEQIQKIKLQCIGIGVRRTGGEIPNDKR